MLLCIRSKSDSDVLLLCHAVGILNLVSEIAFYNKDEGVHKMITCTYQTIQAHVYFQLFIVEKSDHDVDDKS